MLRHIILASLAMSACATLMPTKANAIKLTLTPVGSLQRNPGDTIAFVLQMDPENNGGSSGLEIRRIYNPTISNRSRQGFYDSNELSLAGVDRLVEIGYRVTRPTALATFIFDVINPIKDGRRDVSARVDYRTTSSVSLRRAFAGNFITLDLDVQPVPEPVPEPLTIFGTAIGLGYGAILKRKYSKNIES